MAGRARGGDGTGREEKRGRDCTGDLAEGARDGGQCRDPRACGGAASRSGHLSPESAAPPRARPPPHR